MQGWHWWDARPTTEATATSSGFVIRHSFVIMV